MASLEERVAALEERLGVVEEVGTSMDEDQRAMAAQVKATNLLVQALSITQSEHTRALTKIQETVDKHTGELTEIREGQSAILVLLNELIRRDDDQRTGENGVGE
jgi:septal ring factor EnvC (AmiA/AmiB activator)